MRGLEALKRLLRRGLKILEVDLPERDVRLSTAAAAAFNAFGMPIQAIILRGSEVPRWPEFFSMTVGCLIFALLATGSLQGRKKWMANLFVLNAASVSLGLYIVYSYSLGFREYGFPFQATKLGALVAGMLAPGFWVGLASITIHVGSSVFQYLHFPADVQATFREGEPWATLAFGLAGVFILAHRLRIRQLEIELRHRLAEAEASRRLAKAFLELRDLMNTPVQSIGIAIALLKTPHSERAAILGDLQTAWERLCELNLLLKKYEHEVDWAQEGGGLGAPPARVCGSK